MTPAYTVLQVAASAMYTSHYTVTVTTNPAHENLANSKDWEYGNEVAVEWNIINTPNTQCKIIYKGTTATVFSLLVHSTNTLCSHASHSTRWNTLKDVLPDARPYPYKPPDIPEVAFAGPLQSRDQGYYATDSHLGYFAAS